MLVCSKFVRYFLLSFLLVSCRLGGEGKPALEKQIDFVPNEYVFSLTESLDESAIRAIFKDFPIEKLTEINARNHSYKISFVRDPGIEVLNEAIRKSGKVRFIERNSIYKKN